MGGGTTCGRVVELGRRLWDGEVASALRGLNTGGAGLSSLVFGGEVVVPAWGLVAGNAVEGRGSAGVSVVLTAGSRMAMNGKPALAGWRLSSVFGEIIGVDWFAAVARSSAGI